MVRDLLGHKTMAMTGRYVEKATGPLRVTPEMAAGVSGRLWEIDDIVKLVEDVEPRPGERGPYKKRNAN